MKILFVVPRYHTNMIGWINALQLQRHEIVIHALNEGVSEEHYLVKPKIFEIGLFSKILIKILGHGGPNLKNGFPSIIKYINEFKKAKPEIIVVRDVLRPFSLLAMIIAVFSKSKIIIYSQTDLHKYYSIKRKIITKFILFFFRAVWITPIKGVKETFKYHPKKMYFVPFAVPVKNKEFNTADTVKIVTIGKFVKRKNHILLIKAISELLSEGYNLNLQIVGEVSNSEHNKVYDKVRDIIKDENLENHINIKLNLSLEQVYSVYNLSDLFILPASKEPASISILEAMGYGLPAICSSTCGTRGYIKDLNGGIIFKDGSEESLINSIKTIIKKENYYYFIENIKKNRYKIAPDTFLNKLNDITSRNFGISIYSN